MEEVVDLAGDEAFQASGGFSFGVSVGDLVLHIDPGARVAAFPGGGDDVDRPVGLSVSAPVQPMPRGFPRGSRQRRYSAQHRERGFAVHPTRIVTEVINNCPAVSTPMPNVVINWGAASATKPPSSLSSAVTSSFNCR